MCLLEELQIEEEIPDYPVTLFLVGGRLLKLHLNASYEWRAKLKMATV